MEKIYVENNNNNNKKSSFQKFMQSKGSIICSFTLAVVAIVSLVAAGFNQVSYAIPDVSSALPDSFTTADPVDRIIGSNSNFTVQQYATTGGIQVYCLEHNIGYNGGVLYNKGNAITDYGLLYLMANSYPNVQLKNGTETLNPSLQTWITQISIWVYLNRVGTANNDFDPALLDKIKTETAVYSEKEFDAGITKNYDAGGKNLYTTYIEPLVNNAINHRTTPNKTLSVTKANDQISVTNDEKYYQTSLISVAGSPSDNFNGYKVELSSAPEGTIIVDETGKEIKDLNNLTSATKFYVRVPIDKVNEKNKNVKLSVTGSFKTYEGNYYLATGEQTITSVSTVNNNLNQGLDIQLNYTPTVPNTGMSTAQTIYFIGLIVLLSGVGIIYANVKPATSK